MLEIKTITEERYNPNEFDRRVNEALKEGWELVRRDILPDMFYAELEREIEPEEEEEPVDDSTADWVLVRNPATPFKCSKCGHLSDAAPRTCPNCKRVMQGVTG
jgi:rubrerythrin